MTLPQANWNYPTTIWFGRGRIQELPRACRDKNIQKPLLVTDAGLAHLPVVQNTLKLLTSQGLQVSLYSDVQGNPTGENVLNGVEVYREGKHDGVIALGGGSGLDAGKTIALMAEQDLPLWEFEDVGENWKKAKATNLPPVIAIPTTAGTGSEVGRASVIVNTQSQRKVIIFHPTMLPSLVIADPELTLALPAHLTAWTGLDAMTHAWEAFCSPSYHPMADGIALEAMRLVKTYLPRAFQNGQDLEARGQMLVAATMGATAFQKGLGSVHSLAHPIGAIYNAHHGLTNAILLPYALKQNADAIGEKMDYLSNYLQLPGQGTSGVLEFFLKLRQELNIPHSLGEIEIPLDQAESIGDLAEADPSTPTNAKPLCADDLTKLFSAAVLGDLNRL